MDACRSGLSALFRKQMAAQAARAFESSRIRQTKANSPALAQLDRAPAYEAGVCTFDSCARDQQHQTWIVSSIGDCRWP